LQHIECQTAQERRRYADAKGFPIAKKELMSFDVVISRKAAAEHHAYPIEIKLIDKRNNPNDKIDSCPIDDRAPRTGQCIRRRVRRKLWFRHGNCTKTCNFFQKSNGEVMESVQTFLKGVAPFSLLSDKELDELAKKLLIEFFPKDTVILRRDVDKAEFVYIVRKGAVQITRGIVNENERLVSVCGEKDIFGASSVLEGIL
jgi:Predicted signal-transduction protein containing cAMP-binding and CBS domains